VSVEEGVLRDESDQLTTVLSINYRKNLILADCTEERTIDSKDYSTVEPAASQLASRHLQLAMVPGQHLVSVQVERASYQAKVEPFLHS
jgi:hypothetical protein